MTNEATKETNAPTTYLETVLRFRIFRHDDLPEAHKAEMRAEGINPDEVWSLSSSFENEADARAALEQDRKHGFRWSTYKLVDAGEATTIERPLW